MSTFYEKENKENLLKIREHLKELPSFTKEFFRAKTDYTSSKTRLAYIYDLKLFFNFLISETIEFKDKTMETFELKDMESITIEHIEEFMEYLTYYIKDKNTDKRIVKPLEVENRVEGKARKLSALKSMFAYFNKKGKIMNNPANLIDTPPQKTKEKIYLDVNELANLLDEVEQGDKLTKKQRDYHAYTKSRDLALLSLFSGTGIRISEAVGINIKDVNIEEMRFKVVRKGGDEATLYFNDEIKNALAQYMVERNKITPIEGHEEALFLSLQKRRITARAIQNLVKKYSALVSFKKITPHKLRTTFGTNMYRQTGDIYLVADLLGHKDVNTTRKNYADTKDEAGRRAAMKYKLREE